MSLTMRLTSVGPLETLLSFEFWRSVLKSRAPSEDRTHDLQIALITVIMRLTRYLLRYPGTYDARD